MIDKNNKDYTWWAGFDQYCLNDLVKTSQVYSSLPKGYHHLPYVTIIKTSQVYSSLPKGHPIWIDQSSASTMPAAGIVNPWTTPNKSVQQSLDFVWDIPTIENTIKEIQQIQQYYQEIRNKPENTITKTIKDELPSTLTSSQPVLENEDVSNISRYDQAMKIVK